MVIFSRGQFFAHVAVTSICTVIIFSLTSYFHASNTLREIRRNVYCVGVFAFTEANPSIMLYFYNGRVYISNLSTRCDNYKEYNVMRNNVENLERTWKSIFSTFLSFSFLIYYLQKIF